MQQLAARGLSNAQIAARMGITKRTAKQHIADGMSRLDLHTRRAFGEAYHDAPPKD